jgi:hypothetical protein
MKQAIHPNYFSEFYIPSLKPVETTEEKIDDETQSLARLYNNADFKVFTSIVDRVSFELDDLIRQQMASGASYEAIGQSTTVKELAKDVIKRLFNRIGDAYESVESRKGLK